MFYRQIPTATYIPVSHDEVIVKGSAVEGFSLIIEDPQLRGVTSSVIEALVDGGDAQRVHERIGESRRIDTERIDTEDIDELLNELADAGAIARDDWQDDTAAAWLCFVRYGYLPDLSAAAPFTVVGGEAACTLAEAMQAYGAAVAVTPDPDIVNVAELSAVADAPPDEEGSAGVPVFRGPTENVVLVDDGQHRAALYRFNENMVKTRVPFLSCTVDGVQITVGPYVLPGRTPCLWETERQWARATAGESEYETLLSSGRHPRQRYPLVARGAFAATAAPWLVELAVRGTSSLTGEVLRARATDGSSSRHSLMRLPRCPVCMPLAPALRNLLY